MKTLSGKSTGFTKPIIARVCQDVQKNDIWPLVNMPSSEPCAYILRGTLGEVSDVPQFILSDNASEIYTGDIIMLEPNGKATVLYEANLNSNSLVLTNSCNLSCVMCPQPKNHRIDDELSIAMTTLNLIQEPPEYIGLTGGEPTMDWNKFIQIVLQIRRRFPDTSIQLLTNGMVLQDFDKVKELSDCCEDSLMVCVPLYSDVDRYHDEIVGKKGAFWYAMEALSNLARLDVYVELRTVLMQMNINRLVKWSEFVSRYLPYVGHVSLMGIEPFAKAKNRIQEFLPKPNVMASELKGCISHFNRVGIRAYIYNIPLCHIPGRLRSFCRKSISEWKRCYSQECSTCSLVSQCGGFFESWSDVAGFNVNPLADVHLPEMEEI